MNINVITDKFLTEINKLLEYLMGGLMLVLVTVTFIEVIRRYVFNNPTSWSSELCRFLLIWITFTGAAIVTKLGTHLSMGFTIHRFVNKRLSRIIKVVISLSVMIIMANITYWGTKVVMITGARSAPMMDIPMYIPWAALPINAGIMTLYMMAETIKHLTGMEVNPI